MTLEKIFNMFVVLLVVVDPVGVTPVFGALTRGSGELHRRRMAVKGTLLAAAILLIFALIGDWLLTTLGITLPAFKIAGGVLCSSSPSTWCSRAPPADVPPPAASRMKPVTSRTSRCSPWPSR